MEIEEIEMVKIYWEEFKYRHDHYWKSFFKFSFAILFLLILPYAYKEKLDSLGDLKILVPILSCVLSIVSAWLLAAEYERIRVTNLKFQELKKPPFNAITFENVGFKKILNLKTN
ncbi:hypothetical protein TW85_23095 [Marinomonas sp. S3726]|uniref:hypothetical protein n=1 Tax=Marinomonas sp. S3726 TaxID=579484 RepID=UPI0005FA0777|nr:hypothetical protein [Marinomonas sp. S3726]KJZ08922.1 hypothetical protein TW85_23095 [Marinomonas sp. S3726]